jgi:hypothetical protein
LLGAFRSRPRHTFNRALRPERIENRMRAYIFDSGVTNRIVQTETYRNLERIELQLQIARRQNQPDQLETLTQVRNKLRDETIALLPQNPREFAIDIDDKGEALGGGAVGSVYSIGTPGYREKAAKIYHDPREINLAKIAQMLRTPPRAVEITAGGKTYPQYAWPTHLIISASGEALGYLMPKVDLKESVQLLEFLNPYLLEKLIRTLNSPEQSSFAFKLLIGRNLSAVLAQLNDQRHCMIDFNPRNIRVFTHTHIVALLDCDGFRVQGHAGVFPATQFYGGYIAPEALENDMAPETLGENQERFALGVLLFSLLNYGIHPFQGIQQNGIEAPSSDDKVREGLYPYGITPHPAVRPFALSVHDCFDDRTRAMFDRAFARSLNGRPSPAEWGLHLQALIDHKTLEKCTKHPNDVAHGRFPQKACIACAREQRRAKQEEASGEPTGPRPWWKSTWLAVVVLITLAIVGFIVMEFVLLVSGTDLQGHLPSPKLAPAQFNHALMTTASLCPIARDLCPITWPSVQATGMARRFGSFS